MILNQGYIFLIFILNGIIIGMLFDFFRVLRKLFRTNNLFTNIEDIVFWILTGISIAYTIFKFNYGEIRFYTILGIAIGLMMYIVLFSKIIIKISLMIATTIKKTLEIIFFPIKWIYRKVLINPTFFIFLNIKKALRKIIKTIFKKKEGKNYKK